MRDPGRQWYLLEKHLLNCGGSPEPALCEFVSCLRHPQALAESVGPALVDWLLALEGNQRGDRERPTLEKHVAEALCVLLRGSLCVFQPTGSVTDHACSLLRAVFRALRSPQKGDLRRCVRREDGVSDVARAASVMIARLAPAWSRVRPMWRRAAARLAALCALAAACVRSTRRTCARRSFVDGGLPWATTPPADSVKAPAAAVSVRSGAAGDAGDASQSACGGAHRRLGRLGRRRCGRGARRRELGGFVGAGGRGRAELGAEASSPRLSFFNSW